MNRLLELVRDEVEELEMEIEREESINSFRHLSQEEVNLVKACCRLLEGLDHIAEADRLKGLVGRMDEEVIALEDRLTTRDLYIEGLEDEIRDLEDEIVELREELYRKVDRIDFLEEELDEGRVEGGVEGWVINKKY